MMDQSTSQPMGQGPIMNMLKQLSSEQARGFTEMKREMQAGFQKVDERLDQFNSKIQASEQNIDMIEYQLEELESIVENSQKDVLNLGLSQDYSNSKSASRRERGFIQTDIKIKEFKVNILKDVPWRVRQIRKDFSFLTNLLLKQNIRYKWIYPEGLTLQWEKKTRRLDSLKKARAFAEENADKLGYVQPSTSGTSSDDEDATSMQTNLGTQAASGAMTALQKKDNTGEDKPERRLREGKKK
ncbi:hypothetical protein JRQ81_012106, partial [Phrynocephalus forsythii]